MKKKFLITIFFLISLTNCGYTPVFYQSDVGFKISEINSSLSEIERVGKSKFICVESYRNELEQFNLQCWALTAETLVDTSSWKWLFKNADYTGDYEFIFFK